METGPDIEKRLAPLRSEFDVAPTRENVRERITAARAALDLLAGGPWPT